ncbi:MAG TPA: hypothetical protein VNM92_07265 [Thermoanaerobaculia bacterium]|nr:hypothetical protein [Thermoanaerobaculia bacterium]
MNRHAVSLAVVLSVLVALPAVAQNYSTNFDSFATGTPAEQLNVTGITFVPNPAGSFIIVPSFFQRLTGQVLVQPDTSGSLEIRFATAVTSVSFDFAQNSVTAGATSMLVQAFRGSTAVGSVTQPTTTVPGEVAEGRVVFSLTTPFDRIVLSSQPTDTFFAIDNLVTGEGEPPVVKPAIISFTASPNPARTGLPSTLLFSTANATAVTIDQGVGAVALSGTVNVQPTFSTTYTLTATGPGGTTTASVRVEVITDPAVIVAAFPLGMLQTPNAGGAADRFVLTNVGGAATTVSFSTTGASFFTVTPSSLSIAPGASQTIILTGTAQGPGSYQGAVNVTGPGVPAGLSIPVRLLVAAPPVGVVNPVPSTNRVDTTTRDGSLTFTNNGSATLQGILVSDVLWMVPQAGVITIPPGQTVTVTFTIDRSKRPDGNAPNGSVTGSLTLNYFDGSGSALTASRIKPMNGPPPTSNRPVTVIHTAAPIITSTVLQALAPGEIALFLPALVQKAGRVTDLSLVNAFSPTPLQNQVSLFYIPSGSPSTAAKSAPIAALPPNVSVQFASVVQTVFQRSADAGSLQLRTQGAERLSLNASLFATMNPRGFFGGSLPVFRSDRGAANGEKLYVPGARKDSGTRTDLYLQEVSGFSTTLSADFVDTLGTTIGTRSLTLPPFGPLEVTDAAPAGAVGAILTNTGNGKLVGQLVLVDTTTNDSASLTDTIRKDGSGLGEPQLISLAESRQGQTTARTELVFMNRGASTASGTLSFFPGGTSRRRVSGRAAGGSGVGASVQQVVVSSWGQRAFVAVPAPENVALAPAAIDRTISIEPNRSRVINDVLSEIFGLSTGSGYLIFTPSSGNVAISARTISARSGQPGFFGTAVPAVALSTGMKVGRSKQITGLEDASPANVTSAKPGTFRTGFTLIETAGASVTVRATLRYAAPVPGGLANVRAVAFKDYQLTPRGMVMVAEIGRAIFGAGRDTLGDLHNLELDFDVVSGSGAVSVYTLSTDNGSGDPLLRME